MKTIIPEIKQRIKEDNIYSRISLNTLFFTFITSVNTVYKEKEIRQKDLVFACGIAVGSILINHLSHAILNLLTVASPVGDKEELSLSGSF